MNRIDARFAALRAANRCALVPFVTAGDPTPQHTVAIMHALVEGGADIIELGVPFSDPMADGPVIQRASERALRHHVSLRQVLALVAAFRATDHETPVVLMGYLNPVEAIGDVEFASAAQAAGVDGVLTVDLPPEEADELVNELKMREIHPIFLVAPTTGAERARRIAGQGGGFVYYVSLKGVTGAATLDVAGVAGRVAGLRQALDLPVGVGFGIRDAATAGQLAPAVDAVIVGSALVGLVEQLQDRPERVAPRLREELAAMRAAMDRARGPSHG